MKNLFILFSIALVCAFSSCNKEVGECRVHGTLPNDNYEDHYIYMMALDKTIRDSVGVDSALIKDRKFEMKTNKNMMAIILLDYRVRYGTQELLVVEEPGDIEVKIDSISSAHGTKNNDALQRWKDITEIHNSKFLPLLRNYRVASDQGNKELAESIKANADNIHNAYKEESRKLAEGLDDGPLKDFLLGMFPKN